MSELRQAATTLVRTPVFTAVATLSLALGIGANTAMFGPVDQVLVRLLPVANPRELVQLIVEGGRFGSNSGDGVGTFSHPTYLALRDRAVLATLLAVVGLYGVLAFVVTRRTREIGIRMALGAERARVVRLVLGEVVLLLAVGLGAGVAAALAGGRYVESQLFGVAAREPLVYALAVLVLGSAALAAALLPAWRASRISPVRALRYE